MSVLNCCCKWGIVELCEGSEGNNLVQSEARCLLGVSGEVLGIRHHPCRLNPTDVCRSENRGQIRILAERLEDPPALGHPSQVELRALGDLETLRAGLGSQYPPGCSCDCWIKTRSDTNRRRKLGDAGHVVGNAIRAVREGQRRNTERRNPNVDVLGAPTSL